MNNKPEFAWNLYISIDNHLIALSILNFIAHEFYRMGHYYYSFKSFLFLEKFSLSTENSNGKLASASGVFYLVMSEKIHHDKLQEVIHYLTESSTSSIQSDEISKMISLFMKWGKENGVNFSDQSIYDPAY
jgi:intraflagellar transport protein 56